MTIDIYKPQGCNDLSTMGEQQIRLGLQAPPFNGKTFAAMTFPNPVVLSFDQKLGAFEGRSDIIEVPFWNGEFTDKIVKRDGIKAPPNRKDSLLVWLATEGTKLTKNQTLVLDGSTGIEAAFHGQYRLNPKLTAKGDVDGFDEWKQKGIYFEEVMLYLKGVKCHVIYICHETPDRDKTGELNGKNRPLLTGQFGDRIAGNFTDWFRVLAVKKPTPETMEKFKAHFKLDDSAVKEWIASNDTQTLYVFQTQSDEKADCGTSSLIGAPKYILADYKSFSKYKRVNKQTT